MIFEQVISATTAVDIMSTSDAPLKESATSIISDNNVTDIVAPTIEENSEAKDIITTPNTNENDGAVDLVTPQENKETNTLIENNNAVDLITDDNQADGLTPAENDDEPVLLFNNVTENFISSENLNENNDENAEEIGNENPGSLPADWYSNNAKPWSVYREPKLVYKTGEELDLNDLLIEVKTGNSGSLLDIMDILDDATIEITRTNAETGEEILMDAPVNENETLTIHMEGVEDIVLNIVVDDEDKMDEEYEAFQENLIKGEFNDGLDFSLYLIKKGLSEKPVVAYSLNPFKLTPAGKDIDGKLQSGSIYNETPDYRFAGVEIENKVKAILSESKKAAEEAELANNHKDIRNKLVTQLAIWNAVAGFKPVIKDETTPIINDPIAPPEEIENTDNAEALKAQDETTESADAPEAEAHDETAPIEELEETAQEDAEIGAEENKNELELTDTEDTKKTLKFDLSEIDLPYDEVELNEEEAQYYNFLIELSNYEENEKNAADEDDKDEIKVYLAKDELEADLVTIGQSDLDLIERVDIDAQFIVKEYKFIPQFIAGDTLGMLGFGKPKEYNFKLVSTVKSNRKIAEGDVFRVKIMSDKYAPVFDGENYAVNDIVIDDEVVATAKYDEEIKEIVYTFVKDLDTNTFEFTQEFEKNRKEELEIAPFMSLMRLASFYSEEQTDLSTDAPETDKPEISPEEKLTAVASPLVEDAPQETLELMVGETPISAVTSGISVDGWNDKSFRLITTVQAVSKPWAIPAGWKFTVNIGKYLKLDPKFELKALTDGNGRAWAYPTYDETKHEIIYTISQPITISTDLYINQLLAFDTEAIGNETEITIDIVLSSPGMAERAMPSIKVSKNDTRTEIPSAYVYEYGTKTAGNYPYSLPYSSKQYVGQDRTTMNWDITINTKAITDRLKDGTISLDNLGLALYAPLNQGLSNYKVSIPALGINNVPITLSTYDLYRYNRMINTNDIINRIGDNLNITVSAQIDTMASSYTLGIRLTPDVNYIKKIRENIVKNLVVAPPFIIQYLVDPNNSARFDKGFNLVDTRLATAEAPFDPNKKVISKTYNDPSRTMFAQIKNEGTRAVALTVSETLRIEDLDLRNVNNINIGSDIYAGTFDNIRLSNADPDITIFKPEINGTYSIYYSAKKVPKRSFDSKIRSMINTNALIPGTIIQYTFNGISNNLYNNTTINSDLILRKNYDLVEKVGGEQSAFVRLKANDTSDSDYHIGEQIWASQETGTSWRAGNTSKVIMRVVENYDLVHCFNWGATQPYDVDRDKWWDDNNSQYKIKRVVINKPEDLKPYLPTRVGRLESPFTLEQIYKYFKMGLREIEEHPEDYGISRVKEDLNKLEKYSMLRSAFVGRISSSPEIYNQHQKNWVSPYDTELLESNRQVENLLSFCRAHERDWNNDIDQSVELIAYVNPLSTDGSNVGINRNLKQNLITAHFYKPVYISKVTDELDAGGKPIVDESGKTKQVPVSGAKFLLTSSDGNRYEWVSTDKPKELYLAPGSYRLDEIITPEGFKKIDTVYFDVADSLDEEKSIRKNDIPIRISRPENQIVVFNRNKSPYVPPYDVIKQLHEDDTRSFASASREYAGGNYIAYKREILNLKHGENDDVELDIVGSNNLAHAYEPVYKTDPQPHYELDDTKITLKVTNKKSTPNDVVADVAFKKVNDLDYPLGDVEFTLYKEDGTVIESKYTYTDGVVIFRNLSPNKDANGKPISPRKYIVRETKTPAGYKVPHERYEVIVNEEGIVTVSPPIPENTSGQNPFKKFGLMLFRAFAAETPVNSTVNVNKYQILDTGYYDDYTQGVTRPDGEVIYGWGEQLSLTAEVLIDQNAKPADKFTVEFDKKIEPRGLTPSQGENPVNTFLPTPIYGTGGEILATAEYDSVTNSITYTFTDFVKQSLGSTINLSFSALGLNTKLVQKEGDYTFTNKIAGKAYTNNFHVKFWGFEWSGNDFAIKTAISEYNMDIGRVKSVTYLNPEYVIPENPEDWNGNRPAPTGDTTLILTTPYMEGNIDFEKMLIQPDGNGPKYVKSDLVKIYKVPSGSRLSAMVESMNPTEAGLSQLIELHKPLEYGVFPTKNEYQDIDGNYFIEDLDRTGIAIKFTAEDFKDENGGDCGIIIIANEPAKDNNRDIEHLAYWSYDDDPMKYIYKPSVVYRLDAEGSSADSNVFINSKIVNYRDNVGKFEIEKYDTKTDAPLEGVKFTLKDSENNIIGEENATTNEYGRLEYTDLKPGTYYLYETEPLDNYEPPKGRWVIEVDKNGNTSWWRDEEYVPGMSANGLFIGPMLFGATPLRAGEDDFNQNLVYNYEAGNAIVTTYAQKLVDGNNNFDGRYKIGLEIKPKAINKVIDDTTPAKKDVVYILPLFEAMNGAGFNNMLDAIGHQLEQFKEANSNGSDIKVALMGYDQDKQTITNGAVTVDEAKAALENLKPTAQPHNKGIIRAVDYVVNNWILSKQDYRSQPGTGNGFRRDADKLIIMGESDYYWETDQSISWTEFGHMGNGTSPAYNGWGEGNYGLMNFTNRINYYNNISGYRAINSDLRNFIVIDAYAEGFQKTFGKVDAEIRSGYSYEQYADAVGYLKGVQNIPVEIKFNDNFNIYLETKDENGVTKYTNIKSDKNGNFDNAWHDDKNPYDETNRTINLKDGELTLNINDTANIEFEVKANPNVSLTPGVYPLLESISVDGVKLEEKVGENLIQLVPNAKIDTNPQFTLNTNWMGIDSSDLVMKITIVEPKGDRHYVELNKENDYSYVDTEGKIDYRSSIIDEGIELYHSGDLDPDTHEPIDASKNLIGKGYWYEWRFDRNIQGRTNINIYKSEDYQPLIEIGNIPKEKGEFKITKTDENDRKLAGAVFELKKLNSDGTFEQLKDADGNVIGVKTSGVDGLIVYSGLDEGTYKLSETKAPDGYEAISNTWTITVDAGGKTTVKKDENVKPNAQSTNYGPLQFSEAAKMPKLEASLNLEQNKQNVAVPTTALTENDKNNMSLTIVDSSEPGEISVPNITVVNKKTALELNLIKVNEIGNPLSGAKFDIIKLDENGNETIDIITQISDKNGRIKFENLTEGNYIIRETEAPTGYKKYPNEYKVRVNAGKVFVTEILKQGSTPKPRFEIQNPQNYVEFSYLDNILVRLKAEVSQIPNSDEFNLTLKAKDISKILGGKFFYMEFDDDNVEVKYNGNTITNFKVNFDEYDVTPTVSDDYIFTFKLKNSNFVGERTIAPIKYAFFRGETFKNTDYPIVIENKSASSDTGDTTISEIPIELTINNEFRVKNIPNNIGKFTILKKDIAKDKNGNDVVLEGAKFKLTMVDENGEPIVGEPPVEITTNEDGIALFNNLKVGKYKLEETEAPSGYGKSLITWKVVIAEDGTTTITQVYPKGYVTDFEPTDDKYIITNKENKFRIHKVDAVTASKALKNVEFKLTKSNENGDILEGATSVTKYTDQSGDLIFDKLDDGYYRLEESNVSGDYYDLQIFYIVKVENGIVSYTKALFKTDNYQRITTSVTTHVNYKVKFLNKNYDADGTEIAYPGFSIDLYDANEIFKYDDDVLAATNNNSGDSGEFSKKTDDTPLDNSSYYVKLNYNAGTDPNWQSVYIKTASNEITILNFKKGFYQNASEIDGIPTQEIVNYPRVQGNGRLEVRKYDGKDSSIALEGVKFRIFSTNGYDNILTTDATGKIEINNLDNGYYTVQEVSTVDGYVLDQTPRHFIIGGTFKVPENVQGKDVTSLVSFDGKPTIEMSNDKGDAMNPKQIKPNDSEAFFISSKFKFENPEDENAKIKPGDYFLLELSDNINTYGIASEDESYLKLIGPIGILAEGDFEISGGRRYIKYTFTNFVNTQYPEYAETNTTYHIDPQVVLHTGNQNVYTKLNNDTRAFTINVFYSENTYKGYVAYPNSVNRIVHADWTKGEYENIIYVNREKQNLSNAILNFGYDEINSNYNLLNMNGVDYEIYRVNSNYDVLNTMPESYGLDLKNTNYYTNQTAGYNNNNSVYVQNGRLYVNFGDDMYNGNPYIIVVKGKFDNSDKGMPLTTRQRLKADYLYNGYWYFGESMSGTRTDPYYNDSETNGVVLLNVKNYQNSIEFTKVGAKKSGVSKPVGSGDQETNIVIEAIDNPLKDAEFVLAKDENGIVEYRALLNGAYTWVKDIANAEKIKSDEVGKFGWKGLAPGSYIVYETKAPNGYKLPIDDNGNLKPVSEFEVSDDYKIVLKEGYSSVIKNYTENIEVEFEKSDKELDAFGNRITLEGAQFGLYKRKKNVDGRYIEPVQYIPVDDNIDEITSEKISQLYTVESGFRGLFKFKVKVDEEYAIKELKAPKGYQLPKDFVICFKVQKDADGNNLVLIKNDAGEWINKADGPVSVVNNKTEYPATGGMGTIIFTMIGMLLMVASVIFFKRREVLEI